MTIARSTLRVTLAGAGLGVIMASAGWLPDAWAASLNGYIRTPGALPTDALTARANGLGVRAEVGKPLKAAQEANEQQNWSAALAKLDEADAVKDKTPTEIFYIDMTRAITARGTGDPSGAAKSLAAALDTGSAMPGESFAILANIINLYLQAKDYPDTVLWAQRYAKAGGRDPAVSAILIQAEYLSGDYAGAQRDALAAITAVEQAHQKPAEDQLKLLGSCYLKQGDDAGYAGVLEKLVAAYPTPQYWADLIAHLVRRPSFPDRLMLDVNRLQHATGALTTNTQYTGMVELDLQAGASSEAKAIADEGAAKGLVAKALQSKATAAAAIDRNKLDRDEKEAARMKDGNLQVSIGYAYIGFADYEKGIATLEQGVAKGGLQHPDEAKLQLGIAYLQAGQAAKAVAAFNTVSATGGAADLARLWALRAKQGT